VEEKPVVPRNQSKPNRCACGCEQEIGPTSEFAPGHDKRHEQNLKRRFREGDAFAATELVLRGWVKSRDYVRLDNERRENS
jgi:hypothetical protein